MRQAGIGVAAGTAPGTGRQAAVILGTSVGMAFGFSAAYVSTLSVLLKPIASDFDWSRAQTSGVSMLAQLGLAIGAPLIGALIGRLGAHRVLPMSAALFAAGLLILSYLPGNPAAFGLCAFLLGVAAVGTTPAGYLTVLPQVFDRRLGLAMGVAMVGLGLGYAAAPLVTQGWIGNAGWRSAYQLLALSVLLGGFVAAALIFAPEYLSKSDTPEDNKPGVQRASKVSPIAPSALRSWRFWLVSLVLFTVSAATIGAGIHIVPALTDAGMTVERSAGYAALVGIGIMAGRLITGALLDMFQARYVAAGAFALGAVGLELLAVDPAASSLTIGSSVLLFSTAVGAEGDFIPFFVRRYFGLSRFSLNYGRLFAFFALGGVAGPIVFGYAFDQLGDYQFIFSAAAIACALSAALVLTIGSYFILPDHVDGTKSSR